MIYPNWLYIILCSNIENRDLIVSDALYFMERDARESQMLSFKTTDNQQHGQYLEIKEWQRVGTCCMQKEHDK